MLSVSFPPTLIERQIQYSAASQLQPIDNHRFLVHHESMVHMMTSTSAQLATYVTVSSTCSNTD